jgi:uncharacterized protein with NRDE domain
MCLILLATRAHPRFPLIVAANRDEAYARPAASAAFWSDHPGIYGGRDLEHGGTWLAIATSGRFAAITNYRQAQHLDNAPLSRGALTRDYLAGNDDPERYLDAIEAHRNDYRGFSLLAGTPDALFFYSNRADGVQPIPPGVHGLSNRLLNEPWPKVLNGISVLSSLLASDETEIVRRLFELLADRTPGPDHLLPSTGIARERERALSAAFIPGETYGTRASTVIVTGADGDTLYAERTFGPHGILLGRTEQRLQLHCSASARLTKV